ncbi:MAG: alpha-L-fucosidase, partial [Clostridia bacterium]|nr:alpha-L-fucosidase [Clostridia bacterium]
MIIEKRIKQFETLAFGMFVHFGLYSVHAKGEWAYNRNITPEDYAKLFDLFDPDPDWAEELAHTAKQAGCKYITLTARHHDGFSLYDTCGLTDYDAPHSAAGRDLVREFVDACHRHGLVPLFYHTLLDWHVPSYKENFHEYLKYLRASVEILCKNYGKIGGFWFDGTWDKKDADWEEDAMYSLIRSYQPDAMIINNTGLSALGELGHIELDSVTFERGRPRPINLEGSPKYIASEMCQVFANHWGYAKRDFNFKSLSEIIEDLCSCRRYGANYLLNVGPMGNG